MFSHYFAFGDSMSIDLYPALDLGETEVAVALERLPAAGAVAPVGAASLLYQNADRWEEFTGRDLVSHAPRVGFTNLAADGATIGDVFGEQLLELPERDDTVLVTLTVGGNDLLSAFGSRPSSSLMALKVRDILQAYDYTVDAVVRALPNATLVLTTVYDPSDGTGRIPGVYDGAQLPLEHLDVVNDHLRETAERIPGAYLADAHAHFLGHGVTAPVEERWYWRRSIIEPNATGASELRRLWVEALGL